LAWDFVIVNYREPGNRPARYQTITSVAEVTEVPFRVDERALQTGERRESGDERSVGRRPGRQAGGFSARST
jgi:hypothetical protein